MYKAFYGLTRNPFEITPDPSFLYSTSRHNEALAALYYGVRRRKGFVVLTGEVGTGKTLLLRCLLQLLKRNNDVKYAYVFNGRLSPVEFLQYVLSDFGLHPANKNKGELLLELAQYVIRRNERGLTTVLVVDEAHHLSSDILEEIRLLTNLETATEKLLQILLVGQPELDDKLDSVNLRQLKQRIALRSHLAPLTLRETEGYIDRRLRLAGHSDPITLFPVETCARVYYHSRGIPRLINTICENALVVSYAQQAQVLTPQTVDTVASDFRLGIQRPAHNPEADSDADVRKAARTLLELYAQLQNLPAPDKFDTPATVRVRQHEPYI